MANRLKFWREHRGLSMAALGEMVESSGQQIERLEKGQRKLTMDWMVRLAQALDIAPADLLDASVLADFYAGSGPQEPKLIKDPDALALIDFWGKLDKPQKKLFLSLIAAGAESGRSA